MNSSVASPPSTSVSDHLSPQLLSKVTWRLVPYLILLYFVSYLDRVNVSFASLTMNKDLGIDPATYGQAAGLFFIGYFFAEVPSNLALEKFGARKWIARIMFTWGALSMAMAFVKGPWSYFIIRFCLGLAEAGFFPGVVLYLTYWFPARERAKVMALFYLGIPLANVFGAPLSGWILDATNGAGGIKGWQWLFLLEGVPAIILTFTTLFFLTDQPAQASWLTDAERAEHVAVMDADRATRAKHGHMSLGAALANPRVLVLALVYFLIILGLYGLGFWMPQIIKRMGFNNTQTGFLVMVPYGLAAISQVFWCRNSDRTGERRWHFAASCGLMGLGYAMTWLAPSPTIAFVGLIFGAVGIMCTMPVFWTMPAAFLSGTAAAGGIALINSIGNLSGYFGPAIMGWVANVTGNPSSGLLVLTSGAVIAAIIVLLMRRETVTQEPAAAVPGSVATNPITVTRV
ncbi:MAG: MFS transporter [Verrucomicrobia bacterium]|nr:MFS transporter [Verrucomicrobiota bacterium]